MPHSHHRATLSLRHADVVNVGCYDVDYDECASTTNFAADPGSLDIVRVSNAMVPSVDNQPKQHTVSMPPSHHSTTSSLRCAEMGRVGGYDVGYNECFCTTDFATALGRLDIAHVSNTMVPSTEDQPKQPTFLTIHYFHWVTLSLRRADVRRAVGYDVCYN